MSTYRGVQQIITPSEVSEGRGVRVKRIIGTDEVPTFDPFLMLDHAVIRKPNGFPPHPHRGFETVSYSIKGTIMHEDSKGNHGILHDGDVQWMTAGKGIMHVEMPGSDIVEGFQLWVNLKSSEKMCEPRYQDQPNSTIPKVTAPGIHATVIAGTCMGVTANTVTRTPVLYLDVSIEEGYEFNQEVQRYWNAFVYVFEGNISIDDRRVDTGKAAFFRKDADNIKIHAETKCRIIVLAGEPIGETVSHYGPFVMNTREEIQKTLRDFQSQRNGFEGTQNWKPRFITY